MQIVRRTGLPRDIVGAAVLVVAAARAMPLDQIVPTLRQLGAPSWQPATDVVLAVVDGLIETQLLELSAAEGEVPCLSPSAEARARLGELLELMPLFVLGPDINYRLKVVGIDLVDEQSRCRLVQGMAGHLDRQIQQWTDGLSRCPAASASLRRWMKENLNRIKAELAWLLSIIEDARSTVSPDQSGAQERSWPPAVANH